MASISGVNGAVYYNAELTQTATSGDLTFSTGKTITSATIDFETEGFEEDMLIQVAGATSTGNNRIFTITAVSSGEITVNEAVTGSTGDASTGITITEYDPGLEVCGFYNWNIDATAELYEDTDFCSSGYRTYITGYTGWTATADKHFKTTNNRVEDWLGEQVKIRFFTKYVATPTTGSPAQYWEGDAWVTGLSQNTPVDALVDQSLTFSGDGALTLTTKTSNWNTT
jgi:hypothetical protein